MTQNNRDPRRLTRRQLLLAGSAGIVGWSTMASQALASHDIPQGLRRGFGDIRIGNKSAGAGDMLMPGESIITGPGAQAVVVVGADAFLLRENTRLQLEDNGGTRVLRYLSGKVLSVFGAGNKQLVTPTATIGIRGTGCYIEARPERVYFCLCYGAADVTPNANPTMVKRMVTKHHEQPITIDANASAMNAADVINHSDAELIMLEETVGRRPPFFGQPGLARY
ncbi:hypothetical protein [Lacisediminimonas sp.]|uniref:hypothetical protein n=1 Tax=Lacisediminimonas sp. TaxID=3060582 RepID=UPI00271752E4|nr:hypothetical protein [Lacisediminimonas sp.]MDO8299922.1 hypothetical protein [Lacisediminimonas sp.]